MSSSRAISRTEGPTTATWELHRQTINNLYIKDNRPLKDIIEIMRVNHGLVASVKMYKYRLKSWGVRKNSPFRHKYDGAITPKSQRRPASTRSDSVSRKTSPTLEPHSMPSREPATIAHAENSGTSESILKILNHHFSDLGDPSTAPCLHLTVQERDRKRQDHLRSIMAMLRTYDPHSVRHMALMNYFMHQITQLAKQHNYWCIPHGLHLLNRFVLIPGTGPIALMMATLFRDALMIYLEAGHPYQQILNIVVEQLNWQQQQEQQQLDSSPQRIFPPGVIEVYSRCVDDHLKSHFGQLSYRYQEAHLRLLHDTSQPHEFAAEVTALLELGFPVPDMLSILELIFVEELLKECVYMELRIVCPNSSMLSVVSNMSSGATSSQGSSPMPRHGASDSDGDDDDNDSDLFSIAMWDRDVITALVGLIGRLQTAAQSVEGLDARELYQIKLEAADLIMVPEEMGLDWINTPSPS